MNEAQEENPAGAFQLDMALNENDILKRPWAMNLMKSVKTLSKQAVLIWCSRVIKLGESKIDIDSWTSIFRNQLESSFEELIEDVRRLQENAIARIEEDLAKLEQLCKDLHVRMPYINNENKSLYEEQHDVRKLVEEYEAKRNIRLKKLRQLTSKQMELCMALEKEPIHLKESPLPSDDEVDRLQEYIEKLENERLTREEKYLSLKEEIQKIVSEYRIHPELDFEKDFLSSTITEFRLAESNMKQLESYHESLIKQIEMIKEEIAHLRIKVDNLWEMLDEDIKVRDAFRQKYTGNSLTTLNALKEELKRLEALKMANMKTFIDKRRHELQQLWDKCHCDGTQRNAFQFLYSDVYTADLLELHEREIQNWNEYYEENKQLLTLLDKHLNLWNDLLELEKNAECSNRYKNRGGKLLMEERARNKLSKKIPELEQNILDLAEVHELKFGRPFKTFGKTVKEHIQKLHEDREEERKLRLSSKKQQRDNTLTPGKSCATLFPSTSVTHLKTTPMSSVKRYRPISQTTSKRQKVAGDNNTNHTNQRSPVIRVQTKRLSLERKKQRCRRRSKLLALRLKEHKNGTKDPTEMNSTTTTTEYDAFARDLSNKENCRSTTFQPSSSSIEEQEHPVEKVKAVNQNAKPPGAPQTPKRQYLCVPNQMSPSTPSRLQNRTPSKTPVRSPRTPGAQKLKPAPSGSLKLIF